MKKHELLEKAMKDYPEGTIIYSTSGNGITHTTQMPYCIDECGSVQDNSGWLIYYKALDKWAGIVPDKVFVMTSEDGIPLYVGDEFIHVSNRFEDKWALNDRMKFYASNTHVVTEQPKTDKAFSTKEAAEAWIKEQNKPKEIKISHHAYSFVITKRSIQILKGDSDIILNGQGIQEIYDAYKSLQQ